MRSHRNAQQGGQIIAVMVVIMLIIWVVQSVGGLVSNVSPSPTPNAPNYGQRVDVADEWVDLPAGVVFRSCPLLECRVMATSGEGERGFVTRFEAGEIVDGVELWAVVNIDGTEAYAPLFEVLPQAEGTSEVGE